MASTIDDDAARRMTREPAYALSGKIMLSAIVILFAVVSFMVGLHLYARWYVVRLRRRQIERRRQRQRRGSRSHAVFYADSILPGAPVNRGLELAVLNSLPVLLHASAAGQPPSECSVCLSEFEEKEIVRLLPKCNHRFHVQCIDMWFLSNSTCPLCRSPVEKVTDRAEPAEKPSLSEPSTSSASGSCDAGQHESRGATSCGGLRKGADRVEVRIEVPQRRVESVLELTQSSPASRLLSFRRILSIGRRSPVAAAASPSGGCCPSTPRGGAGTSGGAIELDLESGTSESNREPGGVHTAS